MKTQHITIAQRMGLVPMPTPKQSRRVSCWLLEAHPVCQ